MINFEEYKEKNKKRRGDGDIQKELQSINLDLDLLEMEILEEENVSYKFLLNKKSIELEKLIKISKKLKEEAREAHHKLLKNGIIL